MPRYPELQDAAWLRERYVDRGMSTYAIAEEVGCSAKRVGEVLVQHGISLRPRKRGRPKNARPRQTPAAAVAKGTVTCELCGRDVAEADYSKRRRRCVAAWNAYVLGDLAGCAPMTRAFRRAAGEPPIPGIGAPQTD